MDSLPLKTSLGTLWVKPISDTYVDINSDSDNEHVNDETVTVMGHKVGFLMHVYLVKEGWTCRTENCVPTMDGDKKNIYAYFDEDGIHDSWVEDEIKDKIAEAVLPAWSQFALENEDLLDKAGFEDLDRQSHAMTETIKRHKKEGENLDREYALLLKEIAHLRAKIEFHAAEKAK